MPKVMSQCISHVFGTLIILFCHLNGDFLTRRQTFFQDSNALIPNCCLNPVIFLISNYSPCLFFLYLNNPSILYPNKWSFFFTPTVAILLSSISITVLILPSSVSLTSAFMPLFSPLNAAETPLISFSPTAT